MSNPSPERIHIKAPVKTKAEDILEEAFYKDFMAQVERFDRFGLELIKLQIAIPAIYAGILQLLPIQGASPSLSILLIIFMAWLLALSLSFLALFPAQRYEVKANPIIEPLPREPSQSIAINAYIHFAARRKFRLLGASSLCSFFGIAFAVFSSVF